MSLWGVYTSVSSCLGNDAYGICFLHPLFCAQPTAVQACLTFNHVEFGIILIGAIQLLPDAKELHRVSVSQPVGEEKLTVFGFLHVGKADVILVLNANNRHFCIFYVDFCHSFVTLFVYQRKMPTFAVLDPVVPTERQTSGFLLL